MPRFNLPSLTLGAIIGLLFVRERRREKETARLAAAVLESLLNAIDANDADTGAHVRRVANYALMLAEADGVDEHTLRSVERVALFHDIGKIHEALYDIIHDPTALSPAERRTISKHPLKGAEVLAPIAVFYPDLAEGVLSHHERWDGTGYPRHLAGDAIPFAARVTAIADTFDAITHSRRYRGAQSAANAYKQIADGAGSQFDPSLVALWMSPDVREQVMDALARKDVAPPRWVERRDPRPAQGAPDVTFRWRDESTVQPVRDRAR